MTMIEKIARALASLRAVEYDVLFPSDYEAAEAVLDAMREPTEGMIEAGCSKASGFASAGNRMCNGYRAMIDAAKSETPNLSTDTSEAQ